MVNVVTAYQRTRIHLDAHALTIDTPVAWLGVVPHDRRVIDVPRAEIRDARIAPAFFASRLVVAAGFATLPRVASVPPAPTVVCSMVAVLFLMLSVVASIRIETLTGDRHVVPICWFERHAVRSLLSDVDGSGP